MGGEVVLVEVAILAPVGQRAGGEARVPQHTCLARQPALG
jgi:hypothetical protein